MNIKDIPVPEIYKNSADFRFFLKWFNYALTKTQYDTANIMDLYDPLRCPKDLLWLLGDTMGYRYDDRPQLSAAFNRFVMLYFMSLIRHKGSKIGVTLAAEVNLKQKDINAYGKENDINLDRLEDTSIPANAVFVNSNVDAGYIDVVYFTNEKPVDACIEYVRPLGMYCFQYAGVRIDSTTKISVDARLANAKDENLLGAIGTTRVGHYSRNDYARLQHMTNESKLRVDTTDGRDLMYARSSTAETAPTMSAGYRALSSLQLANNDHIVKSLINSPIFDIGYGPREDNVGTIVDYDVKDPKYNLRYNRTVDMETQYSEVSTDPMAVDTLDTNRVSTPVDPAPKVDEIMLKLEDREDT